MMLRPINMANHRHFSAVLNVLKATVVLLLQCTKIRSVVGVSLATQTAGRWNLLLNNTGVIAMHMALTHYDTVVIFDQTSAGPSGYRLRRRFGGKLCTTSDADMIDPTCYAHSVEYDISKNQVRALRISSDTWCSSGSFLSNGTLLQTGGYGSGSRRIRNFRPCKDHHCNWSESNKLLSNARWYATTIVLPEHDRLFVVGGKRTFNYEFVPKMGKEKSYDLPFLHRTFNNREGGNNLYPFVHLSTDGNLFIFANRDSILFNYRRNKVVKTFPRIPGGGARNYPATGSSVMLPLDHRNKFQLVEVMVCGGSVTGAYRAARRGQFMKGLRSCGRMVITGNRHKWNMENMPEPRLLHDMLILPTGNILIINGAKTGCAGWGNARNASLRPYLYKPKNQLNRRFSILRSTKIARMYHSSAIVLTDGRILIAGGNTHKNYTYSNVPYPTELRLQAYHPHYIESKYNYQRPKNVTIHYARGDYGIKYGGEFTVQFKLGRRRKEDAIEFNVYAPPFATHSFSMNQRLVKLRRKRMKRDGNGEWMSAVVEAPPSANVAPAGYYLLTVVHGGIPSVSRWIRIIHS
ncbi:WSC domain-containing protein [Cucumis melo var. makuwa]|uniref:WSC domain-containing protein n=2 Tax=Cucumis melo TaxID=3656 RepID=A0A5A7UW62_CUCMM|nr:WSC domain-containing protein [Cucumis melo var. makuwa]